MDVHEEAGPPHVQTEPPGGATVTVTAQFQVRSVPGGDCEDDLQSGAVGAQTPAAVDPIAEIESEDGARAEVHGADGQDSGNRAGKPETVGSSCSNESCVPTPGCRICFQGAEQVKTIQS